MKQTLSRTLLIGTAVVAAVITWVTPAPAFEIFNDVQPPVWRGEAGTTSQYWMFRTDLVTLIPPDGSIPANGSIPAGAPFLPSTRINVLPQSVYIPMDSVSGRSGIWSLIGGGMDVKVDNFPVLNPTKLMSVQVVWQDIPGVPQTGPILNAFNPPGTPLTAVGPVNLGSGWFETTYKWEIHPNPPDESFIISGNINVDQLLIDTACIPEPSALLLTTLGGGLLLVLRWRRQR